MSDVLIGAAAALLGSLLAGGFSLLAPRLQHGRDHARWLRESRLEAYGDFLSAIDLWMDASTTRWLESRLAGGPGHDEYEAKLSVLEDDVRRTQSRVVLLGPDPLRAVAAEYHYAVLDLIQATQGAETLGEAMSVNVDDLQSARGLLLGVMNRVLGIPPR